MAKRNVHGLIFDSKTGKVTLPTGEKPSVGGDFTFEDHDGYNPLQYATEETVDKLIELLNNNFGDFKFLKTQDTYPTPLPPPVWQIVAERNGVKEKFNAGLVANSVIRTGGFSSLRAEFKAAGLLF